MLWPSIAAEWHPVSRFRMDLNLGYRLGLGTAAVGVVLAVVGYLTGRRVGATAMPVIGGLSALMVAVGFAIAPLFV
jgi:hypothetical protein